MQQILLCLREHNPWLATLAVVICVAGSWVSIRLFERARQETSRRRVGWLFLTGVAAGGAIWCTHFIAMLSFNPHSDVTFAPLWTGASFFIAIFGTVMGFGIACIQRFHRTVELGGAVIGLAIATMHYTGMMAYAINGLILWDPVFVSISVVCGAGFGALATRFSVKYAKAGNHIGAVSFLVLSILSMHFFGMTAMDLRPFFWAENSAFGADMAALAGSIGGVGFLVVGMGVACILLDQEIRDEATLRLRRMAMHDPLTGLPNRAYLAEFLDNAVEEALQTGARLLVVAMDLNRFKDINDRFGHEAGDEALLVFSRRVSAQMDNDAFLARVGGDEFIIVKMCGPDCRIEDFVRCIELSVAETTTVRGIETMLGASLGVAVFPNDGSDAENLIKAADLAMYRAKQDPMSNLFYFEPELDNIARRKRELASDLACAIENDELKLFYQVQKNILHNKIIGHEALLRWNHPAHGMISPAEFIPLAEESGLIVKIGEWVLCRACLDAARWNNEHRVAVNISAIQFAKGSIDAIIENALWQSGLAASRLEIEITESVLMSDTERTIDILQKIKALGVSVAMDDFGTGHSSLANLETFSFDKIKLDRGFVGKVDHSKEAQAIIRAVLALGASLNIPVLAEGVESEEQRKFLLSEGCYEAQGFLFGKPEPIDRIEASKQGSAA